MRDGVEFASSLFDNGLDAVAVLDDNLCVAYWNPEMADLSGVAPERAVGSTIHDLFPASASSAGRFLRRSLAGENLVADIPFFAAQDPVLARQCHWHVVPLLSANRVTGCIVVVRLLTSRFDIEARIREVEQRFRSMADCSPVLLWMADTDGLCNFFNQSWLEFTGRTMEQERGVRWSGGVHPEDFQRCLDTFMDAFTTHQPFEMEYRLRRHDGVYRWVLDRGTPRYRESGEFAGFIGSCVDITTRKQAEEDVQEVAAELKRSNRYMEQMLYAVSHDLREPIRMVTSFLDLLQTRLDGALDDEARSYIGFAVEGGRRMKSLVDGLLELSRLRARTPEFSEVDSGVVVEDVLQDLNGAVIEAAARITLTDLPVIHADAALFRSLVQNLLSNALKFRGDDPPEIRLSAHRNADEWIFSVLDNGIGFESQYAEVVFETFRRLNTRDVYPGNGLGLALARDIVERHNGRIWVKSEPGRGSEFQFALPTGS